MLSVECDEAGSQTETWVGRKNWNYLAEIGLDFTFHSELNTEVEVLLNQVKHSKLNDHNQLKSTDTTLVTSLKSEPNAWNHQWQE